MLLTYRALNGGQLSAKKPLNFGYLPFFFTAIYDPFCIFLFETASEATTKEMFHFFFFKSVNREQKCYN